MNIKVLANADDLAQFAAEWLLQRIRDTDGPVSVCLAGGTTPKRLYETLADEPIRSDFPWDRVHWFWGDERFVPRDDVRSNYRMVCESLLSKVPVPAANVHPVPTDLGTPAETAAAYERTLRTFYGADELKAERMLFDVTFLGLGEDGHIASLFLGSSALDECKRWAMDTHNAAAEPRISLTYPALACSCDVIFLVSGAQKRPALERVRAGVDLPATRLFPMGRLQWLVDQAAASEAG